MRRGMERKDVHLSLFINAGVDAASRGCDGSVA